MRAVSPGKKNGPARKPTAQLKARGSWKAKEREKTEPTPVAEAPEAPITLSLSARQIWDELIPVLDGAGMLTRIDGKALERYCTRFATWRELDQDTSPDPEYKRFDRLIRLSEHLLKFEVQYGMTPSSRSHVVRLEKPAHGNAKSKDRFFQAS